MSFTKKFLLPNDQSPSSDAFLDDFRTYLELQNKSANTIRAYLFAVRQFSSLYPEYNRENLMMYKCHLIEHYKPQTVNLRIRALNPYMEFLERPDSKILMVQMQQKVFVEKYDVSTSQIPYAQKRWHGAPETKRNPD